MFCGSFVLAVFPSWVSGFSWFPGCVVTVLFTLMVNPLIESCSPLVTSLVFAEFSANLLEAFLRRLLDAQ